jgi:tRNA dimethylallyltransferase
VGAPLALVGPTGSGKTAAAVALADRLGAEILSVDSMLVYRGLDVGTAKPSNEDRARVRHHLIDLIEPTERFTVARFQALARVAREEVEHRGRRVLYVGGSGLYFRAAVDELRFPPEDAGTRATLEAEAAAAGGQVLHRRLAAMDPAAAAKIEPDNVRRTVRALEVAALTGSTFSSFAPDWQRFEPDRVHAAGIALSPEDLAHRIRDRLRTMLASGWVEEVDHLVRRGFGSWITSTQAIGYAELASHLEGTLTLDEAMERTEVRTRHLARRQMAWFRRDSRIRWFRAGRGGAKEILPDVEAYFEGA